MNSVHDKIIINSTPSKVWDALTMAENILKYTGSNLSTDWQVNSPITWSGEMHGSPFLNKGKVLVYLPHENLKYTYWSGMGGDADLAENYSEVSFELKEIDKSVELIYNRTNIATELETQIFQAHIGSMLSEIKNIAEHGS